MEQPTIKSGAQDHLKNLPIEELKKELKTSSDGIDPHDAEERLKNYGYNEIPEKKVNPFLKFLTYFWGPIPWMIEAAAVLSALVRHWPDFFIIVVLLLANAVIGFWEEYQAGNAIAALKAKLAQKARVRRGGKWSSLPARELVPGDIIRVRLGDIVPADARLLEGDPVEVDQSALTGESLPVKRKPGDQVFSGSTIRKGECEALVYATGGGTYFGKTAQLVEEAHTTSHFQSAVLKIGNYLIVLAIILVVLILSVALFRGDPMTATLQFVLVLTVASIPVALPTVLSVTMSVGARLLSLKETIVSRLVAIEELAGMDILCSDKTGTLTENRLTLGEPFTVKGVEAREVILSAALSSRAENQDTIDLAVLSGLENDQDLEEYKLLHFVPFDPVGKRTEADVEGHDGTSFKVTKGAPQVILELAVKCRRGKTVHREGNKRFCRKGVPFPWRCANRFRGSMAVPGSPAPL
jgi:H+-transporting ATPase